MNKRAASVFVLLTAICSNISCVGYYWQPILVGDPGKKENVRREYSNQIRKIGVVCYRDRIEVSDFFGTILGPRSHAFLYPTVAAHTGKQTLTLIEKPLGLFYALVLSWVIPQPLRWYDCSYGNGGRQWNSDAVKFELLGPFRERQTRMLIRELPRRLDSQVLASFLTSRGWQAQPIAEHPDGLAATIDARRDDFDAICVARVGITVSPMGGQRAGALCLRYGIQDVQTKVPVLVFVRVKAQFFDTKTREPLLSFATTEWARRADELLWAEYSEAIPKMHDIPTMANVPVGSWEFPHGALASKYQALLEKALSWLKISQQK